MVGTSTRGPKVLQGEWRSAGRLTRRLLRGPPHAGRVAQELLHLALVAVRRLLGRSQRRRAQRLAEALDRLAARVGEAVARGLQAPVVQPAAVAQLAAH